MKGEGLDKVFFLSFFHSNDRIIFISYFPLSFIWSPWEISVVVFYCWGFSSLLIAVVFLFSVSFDHRDVEMCFVGEIIQGLLKFVHLNTFPNVTWVLHT